MNIYIFQILILSITAAVVAADNAGPKPALKLPNKTKEKSTKLPPCKSCSVFVESFKKGMEKTNRGKHGGGDAAWEEEKLRSYKSSEVRLVEIQESLCVDVTRGEDQCHSLANDHEQEIEDWWFHKQDEQPDLHAWLCVNTLKVCCPPEHYGPNCDKCVDCNGNGHCKGNGTRKGNGKCSCEKGYSGEVCNDCALEYYQAFKDETKLLCSPCHSSCGEGGCTGAGPKACRKCKVGWQMNSETGCFDINECIASPHICKSNQFCVNNEGSYSCLECDRSCNACDGDGPDMCKACASGYELRDGKCTDLTGEKRDQYVTITRFLTYLGLCVATCVIFQNSTKIASLIGLAVAVYIAASEYWLNSSPSSATPQMDTKQIEDMIMNSM